MPADLINIDNLVLSDDFETWFERTNEVIDALNPLQSYDFYDNFYATGDGVQPTIAGYTTLNDLTEATTLGLKITRDVRFDGDMLIEIIPEAPLGFNTTTGRLGFVFTGPLVTLLGTSCSPPDRVENDDRYIVWDDSATITKVVEASNMLPPTLLCDHTFGDGITPVTITILGDFVVSGQQTILDTVTVEAQDHQIDLSSDGTGTGTPAGDDTIAGAGSGGGIRLLSTDGNKNIVWTVADNRWHITTTDPGDRGFQIDSPLSLFVRTIEPLTDNLDILGFGTGDAVSIHLHDANDLIGHDPGNPGPDNHWRFTLRDTSTLPANVPYTLGAYPIGGSPLLVDAGALVLQHATAPDPGPPLDLQIYFDSITPTNDPLITGFARNLNADLLDGCHAGPVPTPFFIPCADATGQIDSGWLPFVCDLVKEVNQTAHGFVVGQVVRIDDITPFNYILAQADSLVNAEAVGVVKKVVDANNFELNMRGCIVLTTVEWDAVTGGSGGLNPGQAYFLDKTTAGAMTDTTPTPGSISKTMLIAVTATQAIVMNYVGGLTDPAAGTPIVALTGDVIGTGLLTSPITTTIVERTVQQTAAGGTLALSVEDSTGAGYRTFEISITASTTLELQEPSAAAWNAITTPDFHTNSVTLVITQDGVGGHTPTITISGGGTIVWDNSASQPVAQTLANKTTIYTLINLTSNPGVWYGVRAVLEL